MKLKYIITKGIYISDIIDPCSNQVSLIMFILSKFSFNTKPKIKVSWSQIQQKQNTVISLFMGRKLIIIVSLIFLSFQAKYRMHDQLWEVNK